MGSYIVLDLEMCSVPKNRRTKEYHWATEIIQIGAVRLNDAYEIIDEFCTYVAPQYGRLTSRISNLTGIHSDDLKDAPYITEALQNLRRWLPENPVFVAWSETDKCQLGYEIKGKHIEDINSTLLEMEWMDCQKMFDDKVGAKDPFNLTNALNLADINYRDGIHDGLVDAYNTALLFRKLMTSDNFTFNKYYANIKETDSADTHLSVSMGSLLSAINLETLAAG